MSQKVIKIKRGLDIKLVGEAEKVLKKAASSTLFAMTPDEFIGVVPKLLVAEGDSVQVGTPIFFDKAHPEVLFASPVAGVVKGINRGEKRKILNITIETAVEQSAVKFEKLPSSASAQQVKERILGAGYWPMIMRRPYGVIADSAETPRDIFVSGLDSAPLGVDYNFLLEGEAENLATGIAAMAKLTSGKVHIGVPCGTNSGALSKLSGAEVYEFAGKHPAGNVGVQIEKIAPISKGEVVWTLSIVHLAMIGRMLRSDQADFSRSVAVVGSCAKHPQYIKTTYGAQIATMVGDNTNAEASKTGNVRIINGNVLSGSAVSKEGFVGFYNNAVSLIPEGDYYEFIGWAMPRLNKFSASKSYFSWLTPNKKYNADTNMNGGERAFVANSIYQDVMPMNILPVYLMKAVMAEDIDKMEQLGIYEVIEEDVALCEFVCPSKIEWQDTLRKGLDFMMKNA
ncbi:MAG: Na(+)-translocating NADH-quinone reductase subunit A [Rikenellaceae bacterium]